VPRVRFPLRRTGRAVAVVALGLCPLGIPAAAQAHPFGDPQQLEISAGERPGSVTLTWRVGMSDDLTWLALDLGLLPEDRVMLDGAVQYDPADAVRLAGSDELTGYLRDHLRVTNAGTPCAATVRPVGDLADDGASVDFACEGPVSEVEVTASMLTDLHPAYRTMATGPGGQRYVYDGDNATHSFSVDAGTADAGLGRSAAFQLGGALGGTGLAGLTGWLLWRRRSRPA
jgi:hypothetical protein